MKTTVSFHDFERAFADADRANNFSRDGLKALFDYLEDYEDQTGQELELDVISLCCDFCEDTPDDIISVYSIDVAGLDDNEKIKAVRGYLNDNTTLVGETANGFIYAAF